MDLKTDIINYISKISRVPVNELNDNTELYNSNIISSLNLLELMSFIEQQYKIYISPEELIELNFKNIETLSNFVALKITHCAG